VDESTQHEREVRAARNQALFRAVNEQMRTMNEAFASVTRTFAIAGECADTNCIKTLEIAPDEYAEVRANPRHFAVLPGHVYPDVERVIRESEQYVVVEKVAESADVAEYFHERTKA
jgi:hypothetical protein